MKTLTCFLILTNCFITTWGEDGQMAGKPLDKALYSIIPLPQSVTQEEGVFLLSPETVIQYDSASAGFAELAQQLRDSIQEITNASLAVSSSEDGDLHRIELKRSSSEDSQGPEGYRLSIGKNAVQISASEAKGAFYGIQTLRQILSTQKRKNLNSTTVEIPCGTIVDRPAYRWRGLLLDCARHFMSVDFLKRYIDLIAYHKMNVLHLHLTDDQGWRVESKKYPRLMEIGAYRREGDNRYGGYYTQEELKDLVRYAESRFVLIVPEFEMPGHATAAIASYPELSCHKRPLEVQAKWGIFEDVFCPGKENTFEFLQGILEEWLDIFPSRYIHIGGDEAPRKNWQECPDCQKRLQDQKLASVDELQGYLIRRIEKFLSSQNRIMIGWDEILDVGELPKDVIVQSWRGMEGAIRASRMGHDVISSPNPFVYFDYPQDEVQEKMKPEWMSVTTLEKVYSFQPTPSELSKQEAAHILGAECAMWTEHAPQDQIDIQLFPRMCAYSETIWTTADKRDWSDFSQRLDVHENRLKAWPVEFWKGKEKE